MSKGLEALKDFYIFFKQCEIENKYDKQLTNHFLGLHNIIEQELKDHEQLQEDYDNLRDGYYALSFQYDRLKNEKERQGKAFDTLSKDHEKAMKELSKEIEKNRALEIIKKKPRLDLVYIRDTEDYNDYVMTLNIASYGLENEDVLIYATEEEYKIVKEVLL